MGISETFAKQGGMKLIKQYRKSGALLTAGLEFLILGKETKALEILRLSAEYKTKKRLERKYRSFLEERSREYDASILNEQSNKVWICWFQGIENAPDMVKTCYDSIKRNLSQKEIILITAENMSDYAQFPDYIIAKWKAGIITNTHMTDLLRLELLLKYGGTWIDSTVYCAWNEKEIPEYYFNSELFFFQNLKPGRDGASTFISSWYLSACSNNKILWLTKELLYEYWKTNVEMVDYFLLHDFLCIVLEKNEKEWNEVVPVDNSTPHILLLRLFKEYDERIFESSISQVPFHKLSYKFDEKQLKLPGTYYKKMMGEKIIEGSIDIP